MNDAEKHPLLEGQTLRLILGFLVAGAMGGLPSMAFSPLSPFFAAEFALTEVEIGLVTTAMGAGSLVCSLPAGKMVDDRGSRPILIATTSMAVVLLAGVSFTTGSLFLLGVYFVSGSLRPFSAIASTKATMASVSEDRRATSVGLVHVGPSLASALTSALLPALAVALGWRFGVRAAAAALLPVGWWLYRILPRESSLPEEARMPGTTGVLPVLNQPGFRYCLLTWASFMAGLFIFLTFFVLYLTQGLGLSPTTAGLIMALVQVAAVVGRPFWGVVSDRFLGGSRVRAALLMGIASTAALIVLVVLPVAAPLTMVVPVALAAGGSIMSSRPVGTTLAVELVSDEQAARALAVLSLVTWVVAMLFPPLFGFIITATGSWRLAWIFASLVMGVSIPLMLAVPTR